MTTTADIYLAPTSGQPATTSAPAPPLMHRLDSVQRVAGEFALPAATTQDYAEKRRDRLIERLIERSLSNDGFDWEALARVDQDAWGIDDAE